MQNIIFFISLAFMQPLASTPSQPIYAVEPNEPLSVNVTQIKRSRGKGKGQSPWFAKYM